jgi:hypothetical protein
MSNKLLAMSSEIDILFDKRMKIMTIMSCLDTIENNGNDEWIPEYDPTGDEGDIQRAHIEHIEFLREQAHNLGVCLESIEGVFLSLAHDIPESSHIWYQDFLAEFKQFRTIIDTKNEYTEHGTNEVFENQITRTLEAFTELFLKYTGLRQLHEEKEEQMTVDSENVGHEIVFTCDQLYMTFVAFALWIRLDVAALRRMCDRISQSIDKRIMLQIALDHKEHWYSTITLTYRRSEEKNI